MVAWVIQSLSDSTSACKTSGKGICLHFIEHVGILSRSQAVTPKNKISKAEGVHKIVIVLLQNIQLHDQLDMSWRRWAFHDSFPMNTGRVRTDLDCLMPNVVPCKTPPSLFQSDLALMSKLHLFLRSGSLTIYNFIWFEPFCCSNTYRENNNFNCKT